MRIKTLVAGLSSGLVLALGLPTLAVVSADAHYELGGSAHEVQPGLAGSDNAVEVVADDSQESEAAGQFGGNVIFNNLDGTNFSELTTLSSDYHVTVGDCGGGSPRLYTMIDTDGVDGADKIVVYYFTQNNATCGNDEQNSGNLAEDDALVQIGNLDGSDTTTTTLAAAKALYPNATITETSVVADFVNAPDGQTVIFDNVNLNGEIFTFEPALTYPEAKDDCKKGGWKTFTGVTYKNQGDCVSSFASTGRAGGNPITANGLRF